MSSLTEKEIYEIKTEGQLKGLSMCDFCEGTSGTDGRCKYFACDSIASNDALIKMKNVLKKMK